MMAPASDDRVHVDLPVDVIPIDLGPDCTQRIALLAARTPALAVEDRRRLAIGQEFLVRMLQRAHVRYAGHLIRRSLAPEVRVSVALLYVASAPVEGVNPETLEKIAAHYASSNGQRDVGMVDLAGGRALALAETMAVGTGAPVWHGRVVLPHRNGRSLVTVGLTTLCVEDHAPYSALVAAVAHAIEFDRDDRSVADMSSTATGRITAALDGPGHRP